MKWVLVKKEIKENFFAINGTMWLLFIAIMMSLMAYSFTIDTEWSFLTQTDIMVAVTMMILGTSILMTILVASVSISNEKENGTLESLLLTPTTKSHLAHSKIAGSMFKWLMIFIISIPYVYSLGSTSDETIPMIIFIFVGGSVLIFTYSAFAVGISLLSNSSKNALVLSIGVFIATLMPMFLPDAFRATGLGQILENISPLANITNLMAKVVFMQQDLFTQMAHIVPMVIYTTVAYLFMRLMIRRHSFEGGM